MRKFYIVHEKDYYSEELLFFLRIFIGKIL